MSIVRDILVWSVVHIDLVVFVLSFGAGAATLPFIAMVARGLVPTMVAEPVAAKIVKIVLAAFGGGRLHRDVAGRYSVEAATGDEEPAAHWSRLQGERFGLSYDRDAGVFGDAVEQIDTDSMATDGGRVPGDRAELGSDRGDRGAFVDGDIESEMVVNLGEFLEPLRDADGLDHASIAQDQTLRDEGGDTGMETKWRVIFWLGMGFMGLIAGAGYFYVL